jgi:hypothetical protein
MIRILALALLAGPAFADCATVQTPQGFYVRVDPTCPLTTSRGGSDLLSGLAEFPAAKPPAPEKPRLPGGYYTKGAYAKLRDYLDRRGDDRGSRQ